MFRRDICDECGARVGNLTDHKALLHPKYRDAPLVPKKPRPADDQSSLEKYQDTGDSHELE